MIDKLRCCFIETFFSNEIKPKQFLGLEDVDCYIRRTVISVDVRLGSYCMCKTRYLLTDSKRQNMPQLDSLGGGVLGKG